MRDFASGLKSLPNERASTAGPSASCAGIRQSPRSAAKCTRSQTSPVKVAPDRGALTGATAISA